MPKAVSTWTGLSQEDARKLLAVHGPNELAQESKKSFWQQNYKTISEPMVLLLLASAFIYLLIGDFSEGMLLLFSVVLLIALTTYQERKSQKALDALRDLSSPRALVLRSGIKQRVAANQLVPGDLIYLHEGDRIPADGAILESNHLTVDESLLSGESFPVEKEPIHPALDLSKESNQVYSGTLVVSGSAFVEVTHTGSRTSFGKIGLSLKSIEDNELTLATELRHVVKVFAWSGLALSAFIVLLYGLKKQDWTQALLIGIATEMTLLPEEFPIILTVFMAIGAWRLSKVQVLVRKPIAIERLGAITALCVDKTGTLTENVMQIKKIQTASNTAETDFLNLSREALELISTAQLASAVNPFDPMEKAIESLATKQHITVSKNLSFVMNFPLSEKLLAVSNVWSFKDHQESWMVACKGAPEAVMQLCSLSDQKKTFIQSALSEMTDAGLRVIAVAHNKEQKSIPSQPQELSLTWLGLLGFEDPLRAEVPKAVELCKQAGIRVLMMTGDHPLTATKIATQAGLVNPQVFTTGNEIKTMTDEQLDVVTSKMNVFARMRPDLKLRIIQALKRQNHVVAMTGDGVNDAPSLKSADVGIAMGSRGTDVAREASDLVLLDDRFSSIVEGIKRGRTIFENIHRSMGYIAAIHVSIAGLALIPVLLGWNLILHPIHIVFMELIIDPTCSLLFEAQPGSKSMMQAKPRPLTKKIFSQKDFLFSFLQGFLVFVVSASLFFFYESRAFETNHSRSMSFLVLVLCNLGLILCNVSQNQLAETWALLRRPLSSVLLVLVIAVILLGMQIPVLSALFKLAPLNLTEILTCFLIALLTSALLFLVKKHEPRLKTH